MYFTSCIVFPPMFCLYVQGGCTDKCLVMCILVKGTSICHGSAMLLFTFAVMHLGHSDFGNFNWEIPTSDFDWNAAIFSCHFRPQQSNLSCSSSPLTFEILANF